MALLPEMDNREMLIPEVLHYIYAKYCSCDAFFPLIASVISGSQKGLVYADNNKTPTEIYVQHSFGFSQIFGQACTSFEIWLQHYLLLDKDFAIPKIRLYTPLLPAFLQSGSLASLKSERQRFVLSKDAKKTFNKISLPAGCEIRCASQDNIEEIERAFNLVTRFWPNASFFINHSHAQVVYANDQPAAICYAAALENECAEIDILTIPEFRGRGLALAAARAFINECMAKAISPLWDCFTNNSGSMALAAKLGFVAHGIPYEFFTIPR